MAVCTKCKYRFDCFMMDRLNRNKDCKIFEKEADFVEVVRCSECKKRNTEECPMTYYVYNEFVDDTQEGDYCSYGSRKEQNNDGE